MLERNYLVAAEVERLLAATQGSRNAARDRGSKPEPPNILTENITNEVSDLYANPTWFSVQILP